ncbi:hypothetical protein [Bradyrhizobium pachyrhizi]|uniref:hypothetical protein n=1 Tax=Bradyrhizobium pachyrhizi TaxID=280333 RepID=UPI000B035677|nr:hypothetical protein [Bradyrhizobium pachyrhizi]
MSSSAAGTKDAKGEEQDQGRPTRLVMAMATEMAEMKHQFDRVFVQFKVLAEEAGVKVVL